MKIRNIFGLTLAATLAFGACAEKDTTAVDQWLGEKFNQEILWDVDSLAFRRTNWESQELASGVQIRKSSIKMWESVQSVSYITFSWHVIKMDPLSILTLYDSLCSEDHTKIIRFIKGIKYGGKLII